MGFIPNSEEWYFNKKKCSQWELKMSLLSGFHVRSNTSRRPLFLFVALNCPRLLIAIERGCNKLKKYLSCASWSCFLSFLLCWLNFEFLGTGQRRTERSCWLLMQIDLSVLHRCTHRRSHLKEGVPILIGQRRVFSACECSSIEVLCPSFSTTHYK